MHIRCPHCTNPIEILDVAGSNEIACPSRGSNIRLDQQSTIDFSQGVVGAKLGKFTLLALVGRGAFGAVYRARPGVRVMVVVLLLN